MSSVRRAVLAAVIGGVLSGPMVLRSTRAAQPPIEWASVLVVLGGSVIAVTFVVGLQVLMRKPSASRLALWAFGLISTYLTASGLSAIVVALFEGALEPSSLLFIAFGTGALIGVGLSAAMYRAAFAT